MEVDKEDGDVATDPYQSVSTCEYGVCSKEDHLRKKNCVKNPWCTFGLGEMKEGIWKDDPFVLARLGCSRLKSVRHFEGSEEMNSHGDDKNGKVEMEKKESTATCSGLLVPPSGLKNLGATCYLNVLIQSLFHNPLMRNSILNMDTSSVSSISSGGCGLVIEAAISASGDERDEEGMPGVIKVLQSAFAHMLFHRETTYNLTNFVELLQLNKSVQQDPQEFSKLLLTQMENADLPPVLQISDRNKKRSKYPCLKELRNGIEMHSTTCTECGYRADKKYAFHDIDLNIEKCGSLEDALGRYISEEELSGDNKYRCGKCDELVVAKRQTTFVETPTVLNIQFLRYVYDRKTFEKKKLKTKVSFPDILSLSGEDYKLVSVLYHLGSSAYGGHYVCDVLQWGSESMASTTGTDYSCNSSSSSSSSSSSRLQQERWWHCDDSIVCKTENPAYSSSSSSAAKSLQKQPEQKQQQNALEEGTDEVDDVDGASGDDNDDDNGAMDDDQQVVIDLCDTKESTTQKRPRQKGVPTGMKKAKKAKRVTVTATHQPDIIDIADDSADDGADDASGKAAHKTKGHPQPEQEQNGAVNARIKGVVSSSSSNKTGSGYGIDRSRDAYLFTYVKVSAYNESPALPAMQPSEELQAAVLESSNKYVAEIEKHEEQRLQLIRNIKCRKEEYLALKSELAVKLPDVCLRSKTTIPDNVKYRLIPTFVLQGWITGQLSPPPLVSAPPNSGCSSSHNEAAASANSSSSSLSSAAVVIIDGVDSEDDNTGDRDGDHASAAAAAAVDSNTTGDLTQTDGGEKSLSFISKESSEWLRMPPITAGGAASSGEGTGRSAADDDSAILDLMLFDPSQLRHDKLATVFGCAHDPAAPKLNMLNQFKIISVVAYDHIMANVKSKELSEAIATGGGGDYFVSAPAVGWSFDSSSLRCDMCYDGAICHEKTLKESIASYERVLRLIDESNPRSVGFSRSKLYWVSKTWVTALRKEIQILKKNGSNLSSSSSSSSSSSVSSAESDGPPRLLNMTGFDETVNSNLLCSVHGSGGVILDYIKKARKVSDIAWKAIRKTFPQSLAILAQESKDGGNSSDIPSDTAEFFDLDADDFDAPSSSSSSSSSSSQQQHHRDWTQQEGNSTQASTDGFEGLAYNRRCSSCLEHEDQQQVDAENWEAQRDIQLSDPNLSQLLKAKLIYPGIIESSQCFIHGPEGVRGDAVDEEEDRTKRMMPRNKNMGRKEQNSASFAGGGRDDKEVICLEEEEEEEEKEKEEEEEENMCKSFRRQDNNVPSYFVVEHSWLLAWRSSLRSVNAPPCGPLDNAALRCPHGRTLLSPELQSIIDGLPPNVLDQEKICLKTIDMGATGLGEGSATATVENIDDWWNSDDRAFDRVSDQIALSARKAMRSDTGGSNDMVRTIPISELITEEQWNALYQLQLRKDEEDEINNIANTKARATFEMFTVRVFWEEFARKWVVAPDVCRECREACQRFEVEQNSVFENKSVKVRLVKSSIELEEIIGVQSSCNVGSGGGKVVSDAAAAAATAYDTAISENGEQTNADEVIPAVVSDVVSIHDGADEKEEKEEGVISTVANKRKNRKIATNSLENLPARAAEATAVAVADLTRSPKGKTDVVVASTEPLRRSSRAARAAKNATKSIVVSSDDTLGLVKLKIMEQFSATEDLLPNQQRLFDSRGQELKSGNGSTLGQLGVKADGMLYVLQSDPCLAVDDNDDDDCYGGVGERYSAELDAPGGISFGDIWLNAQQGAGSSGTSTGTGTGATSSSSSSSSSKSGGNGKSANKGNREAETGFGGSLLLKGSSRTGSLQSNMSSVTNKTASTASASAFASSSSSSSTSVVAASSEAKEEVDSSAFILTVKGMSGPKTAVHTSNVKSNNEKQSRPQCEEEVEEMENTRGKKGIKRHTTEEWEELRHVKELEVAQVELSTTCDPPVRSRHRHYQCEEDTVSSSSPKKKLKVSQRTLRGRNSSVEDEGEEQEEEDNKKENGEDAGREMVDGHNDEEPAKAIRPVTVHSVDDDDDDDDDDSSERYDRNGARVDRKSNRGTSSTSSSRSRTTTAGSSASAGSSSSNSSNSRSHRVEKRGLNSNKKLTAAQRDHQREELELYEAIRISMLDK